MNIRGIIVGLMVVLLCGVGAADEVNLRGKVPVWTDYSGINKGDAEEKYRQRVVRAYWPNEEVRRVMKTNNYSAYENPLGIYFEVGEVVRVGIEGSRGHEMALVVRDFEVGGTQDVYPLKEGVNEVRMRHKGLGYVDYRDVNPRGAAAVKVKVEGGVINGVFTREDDAGVWRRLLKGAKCGILDMLGERCQLAYDVGSLRRYCPERGPELLEMYDRIIELEQDEVMGWGMDGAHPGNHIHGRVQWQGFMHADGLGGAFHVDTMRVLADVEELRRSSWGVGHEFGHVNQTRPGMLWHGTTEITNNICSAWVAYRLDGTYSRPEHEVAANADGVGMRGGRMDCFVNGAVVRRQQWMFQEGQDGGLFKPLEQYKGGDVFVAFAPFWQLMLYNTVARGDRGFYPRIYHDVRVTDESGMTNGELLVRFMRRVCDSAGLDFGEYFVKVGMAAPVDREVDDYGKGFITVTEEMVQELLDYARRYPKPDSEVVYYICANNVDIFRERRGVEVGEKVPRIELPVDQVDIPGDAWRNAVAFEAWGGGKLLRVSLKGLNHEDNETTTVVCPPETDRIEAVGWDGKRVTVCRLSDDPEVRREWMRRVKVSRVVRAIREGRVKELRRRLEGVEVNGTVSEKGESLLSEAIEAGNAEAVKVLLDAGADPNERRRDGKTPLHVAAGRDEEEVVGLLLDAGADPMAQSGNGAYAIHEAAWTGGLHALRRLLPCYKEVNFNPDGGVNGLPVVMAMERSKNPEMLAEFLRAGMDVKDVRFEKMPLMSIAVKVGSEEMVRMLREKEEEEKEEGK